MCFVFCCAGFLAGPDRAQPSTMPVPPPPAPPPPPTLALVSFTGGKCTVLSSVAACRIERDVQRHWGVGEGMHDIWGKHSNILFTVDNWSYKRDHHFRSLPVPIWMSLATLTLHPPLPPTLVVWSGVGILGGEAQLLNSSSKPGELKSCSPLDFLQPRTPTFSLLLL